MDYILYYSSTSPHVRKVWILLHELNLLSRTKFLDGLNINNHNPLQKLPTLLTKDNEIIYNSSVICEYLDLKYAPGAYFPSEFKKRFHTLTLYSLASEILDIIDISLISTGADEKNVQNVKLFKHQERKLLHGLTCLESEADFLESSWNIASITTMIVIDYIDFRLGHTISFENYKKLRSWRRKIKKDSLIDTYPQ